MQRHSELRAAQLGVRGHPTQLNVGYPNTASLQHACIDHVSCVISMYKHKYKYKYININIYIYIYICICIYIYIYIYIYIFLCSQDRSSLYKHDQGGSPTIFMNAWHRLHTILLQDAREKLLELIHWSFCCLGATLHARLHAATTDTHNDDTFQEKGYGLLATLGERSSAMAIIQNVQPLQANSWQLAGVEHLLVYKETRSSCIDCCGSSVARPSLDGISTSVIIACDCLLPREQQNTMQILKLDVYIIYIYIYIYIYILSSIGRLLGSWHSKRALCCQFCKAGLVHASHSH